MIDDRSPTCRALTPAPPTQALTNVTYRNIELLADSGLAKACQRQLALLSAINAMDGKLTHKAVAEAHGMECSPVKF